MVHEPHRADVQGHLERADGPANDIFDTLVAHDTYQLGELIVADGEAHVAGRRGTDDGRRRTFGIFGEDGRDDHHRVEDDEWGAQVSWRDSRRIRPSRRSRTSSGSGAEPSTERLPLL